MTDLLTTLRRRARSQSARILLPEAHDCRVLDAAARAQADGIAQPVLFGPDDQTRQLCAELGIDIDALEFLPYPEGAVLDEYAAEYAALRDVDVAVARELLTDELVLAALLTRLDEVDGLVAGAVSPTAEVVAVANGVIGLDPAIDTASSYFIMQFDDETIGEDGVLLYADCGVNIAPSEEQLADIAVTTASTASELFGWSPRVAMLSFSTKGSAQHQMSERVANAAAVARRQVDDGVVDGELQADVALVPDIADRKTDAAAIRGDANIFIFPNLDAGNIAYKLTERLSGATALGPILQGYARPVSDLSRGASADDIYDILTVTACQVARGDFSDEGEILTTGLLRRRETSINADADAPDSKI
ncbi:phosphotransacetylase [Halomarina halobia]|uniref:Phosphotransacetylase n=1 Tax=Halomarina halobia TaxID=3033386 RepID=A0ABD6AE72_9EURY|nr:phosphotransacetylase [Halomarina sp. PSR21]